jgi:hypothetical protein
MSNKVSIQPRVNTPGVKGDQQFDFKRHASQPDDVSLYRAVTTELSSSLLEAQLASAELAQTEGTIWGNLAIGRFGSLGELHDACVSKINELDAEHGIFTGDGNYSDYTLHSDLSLRRDRILRGGPIWSWASSSTNDGFAQIVATFDMRNSSSVRLSEMADQQESFLQGMEEAVTLEDKREMMKSVSGMKFSGDAKISKLTAASDAFERDEFMFERAQISEYRLGDSPPDHWSNEDMVNAMTATLAAQNLRESTAAAFETAFESAKADIQKSSQELRKTVVNLGDDVEIRSQLANSVWENGWPGTTGSEAPPMPDEFRKSALVETLLRVTKLGSLN